VLVLMESQVKALQQWSDSRMVPSAPIRSSWEFEVDWVQGGGVDAD